MICVFTIRFALGVAQDLKKIPLFYRNQIVDAVEKQLVNAPDSPTRNRKLLANLTPPWEGIEPVWELRIGEYRVFYDVSRDDEIVYVRAVRRKPPGKKTEDIL
jgi:mRNA-degrading endonuclease RelE of RelBE toxin-antitoxin system